MSINISFLGNVGLVRVQSSRQVGGTTLTEFTVASTDKSYKDENGEPYVNYIKVKAWGNRGNCILKARKGARMNLVGKLRQERWKDKQTGKTRDRLVFTIGSPGTEIDMIYWGEDEEGHQSSRSRRTKGSSNNAPYTDGNTNKRRSSKKRRKRREPEPQQETEYVEDEFYEDEEVQDEYYENDDYDGTDDFEDTNEQFPF